MHCFRKFVHSCLTLLLEVVDLITFTEELNYLKWEIQFMLFLYILKVSCPLTWIFDISNYFAQLYNSTIIHREKTHMDNFSAKEVKITWYHKTKFFMRLHQLSISTFSYSCYFIPSFVCLHVYCLTTYQYYQYLAELCTSHDCWVSSRVTRAESQVIAFTRGRVLSHQSRIRVFASHCQSFPESL